MKLLKNNHGIHLEHGGGVDSTLCGDAQEGNGPADCTPCVVVKTGRVTCKKCWDIIAVVRDYLEWAGAGVEKKISEEMCPYCGENVIDRHCKSCGDEYCELCISTKGLCPNCDGRVEKNE